MMAARGLRARRYEEDVIQVHKRCDLEVSVASVGCVPVSSKHMTSKQSSSGA